MLFAHNNCGCDPTPLSPQQGKARQGNGRSRQAIPPQPPPTTRPPPPSPGPRCICAVSSRPRQTRCMVTHRDHRAEPAYIHRAEQIQQKQTKTTPYRQLMPYRQLTPYRQLMPYRQLRMTVFAKTIFIGFYLFILSPLLLSNSTRMRSCPHQPYPWSQRLSCPPPASTSNYGRRSRPLSYTVLFPTVDTTGSG